MPDRIHLDPTRIEADAPRRDTQRHLIRGAALLWGLQSSFLSPTLTLILTELYRATAGQLGGVLIAYNTSGLVFSLLIPAWADRRRNYVRPLLGCALATLALALLLAVSSSLLVATVGLVVLGGPAGVGFALLFAQLRHSGARTQEVVRTRAILSAAWIAGPPLATFLIDGWGNRAVLVAIAVVSAGAGLTAALLTRSDRRAGPPGPTPTADRPATKGGVLALAGVFVLLLATNNAAVGVMPLFVTHAVGLPILWSGIALGVAAGLEIPALILSGRLAARYREETLVLAGCLFGLVYYTAVMLAHGPVLLVGAQVCNALFVAGTSGVGISLFQSRIERPGLATGIYANARRVGAIVSGPLIGWGSATAFGYRGTFALCAALTVLGTAGLLLLRVRGRAPGAS